MISVKYIHRFLFLYGLPLRESVDAVKEIGKMTVDNGRVTMYNNRAV